MQPGNQFVQVRAEQSTVQVPGHNVRNLRFFRGIEFSLDQYPLNWLIKPDPEHRSGKRKAQKDQHCHEPSHGHLQSNVRISD